MRSFPGPMMIDEAIKAYNYRHSRARYLTDNNFEILCSRWWILYKPIKAPIENCERYTLACMTLHNFLRQIDSAYYSPEGFIDSEDSNGRIKPGRWRTWYLVDMENNCFQNLNAIRSSCCSNGTVVMRESFKKYVNSEEGRSSWQIDYVCRTGTFSWHYKYLL